MIDRSILEQPSVSSRPQNQRAYFPPPVKPSNLFKRQQVTKDFEEIEKWLDSKEIAHERQKAALVGRSDLLSEEQDGFFLEHYSIFYSSMKETLGLVKGQSDLTNLLTRMLTGFHESFHQFRERLK